MEHSKKLTEHSDKIHIATKDYLVSGESFNLVWDDENRLLKTEPQPKPDQLSKYYESDQYISHTDSKSGLVNFLYQSIKRYSLQKKARLIKKANNGVGTLLDIGAGTGDFLKAVKVKGWGVNGVEVNEKARSLAQLKGVQLEESINDFSEKKFDVVTLWHVLEHLPNLDETVSKLEELVSDGGHLIIAVPNFKSYDSRYYKEYWAAYDVPRHLWHFSQDSMKKLFSVKMKLVKTKPMIFDSFYVSLISEKYRDGKKFSLRAILIGFWSNVLAWRNREYSSLIYIYKKQNNTK